LFKDANSVGTGLNPSQTCAGDKPQHSGIGHQGGHGVRPEIISYSTCYGLMPVQLPKPLPDGCLPQGCLLKIADESHLPYLFTGFPIEFD
jgi:hypothetical protein